MEDAGQKRASAGGDGPPEKRLKGEPEDTEVYSQRIKKKLQANSRTGQACDRCKERKMKCDSGQDGCQPCQSKNFRCMATDRITGNTHERGETARLKSDVEKLRAQLNAYYHRFGPLPADLSTPGTYQTYAPPNSYSSNPSQTQQMPLAERSADTVSRRLSSTDGPHRGPIHETIIDFVDGQIDMGAFDCPDMAETLQISQATLPLNNSRQSSLTTILGAQKPAKPALPSRDDALSFIDNYQKVIAPYVPIAHGPTFRKQVAEFYDHPDNFDNKPAEIVMITVVLAIFAYQMAIRNPSMRQEKLAESNRLYHYSLSFYSELLLGDSLADMQALALILVHARNLPKPGNSWSLSSMILARAIELNYHRSSSKVEFPPEQRNVLAIELRKRVFWSILGIQVTIAFKMGRPMHISPNDMDVELPHPILDSEITEHGVIARSGQCDFWGHIFLSKKLPLLIKLYENVILVRKPGNEYERDVDELDAQIIQWRQDWDLDTAKQTKTGSYRVATHLIDSWFAEFRMVLHHPRLCTSLSPEVHEKNLHVCLDGSQTMLQNVMSMIGEFKGADFTWHFVSGYVLGMGMAMHVYNKRREHMSQETVNKLKQELQEWLFVMKSADHFMKSGDYLFKFFQPLAQKCLEDAQNVVTASEAVRNGYHHGAQAQSQQPGPQEQPAYSAAEPYQHSTAYSENLSSNTIPTTLAPPAQDQPQQNSYNVHPPPPSSQSGHQQMSQQYDNPNNNKAYQMTLLPTSPSLGHAGAPTSAPTTMHPSSNLPFVVDPVPTYHPHHHHATYPAATPSATSIYPPAIPYQTAPTSTTTSTISDNFASSTMDVYSIPPESWPTNIVQYRNAAM